MGEVFDPAWWSLEQRGHMSAELAMLYFLNRSEPLGADDVIQLILADDEKIIGEILTAVLEHSVPWERECPRVRPLVVPGLNAEKAGEFAGALRTLGTMLVDSLGRQDPVLCICGGFKGTVAAMLLSARYLQGKDEAVRAYYVHERSRELIRLPLEHGEDFTSIST